MVQVVRHGGTPRITGEEAKKSLSLILGVYEASRTEQKVTLS
jgi:hypothetical protein